MNILAGKAGAVMLAVLPIGFEDGWECTSSYVPAAGEKNLLAEF